MDKQPTIKLGDKVTHKKWKRKTIGEVRSITKSGGKAKVDWEKFNSGYHEIELLELIPNE